MKDISGWISKTLSLDPECSVRGVRFDHEFFNVIDSGVPRARHKVVAKTVDASLRPLHKRLDGTVRQVANVPFDLMFRG